MFPTQAEKFLGEKNNGTLMHLPTFPKRLPNGNISPKTNIFLAQAAKMPLVPCFLH
jgi:hypothetical protein